MCCSGGVRDYLVLTKLTPRLDTWHHSMNSHVVKELKNKSKTVVRTITVPAKKKRTNSILSLHKFCCLTMSVISIQMIEYLCSKLAF